MKIYLDTNMFISLVQEEIDSKHRGLFVEARDFFETAKKEKHPICISKLFLREVKKILFMNKKEVIQKLKTLGIQFEFIPNPAEDKIRFFKELKIHFPDYIHAGIAYSCCDCIVTFNIKDFKNAEKYIPIFSPTDF
jgi:predicted nucleic acid-binding protein